MVVTFVRRKKNNLSKHEALKKLNNKKRKKTQAATLKVITAPDFGLIFK